MTRSLQQIDDTQFSTFLTQAGWAGCDIIPLSADMGLRRYMRLEKDGKSVLFMDMSRSGILETGLKEYVEVATYLDGLGVNVPDIYSYDLEQGFAIIEIVGAISFGDKKKEGHDPIDIYTKATDVLIQIKKGASENILPLVGYKKTLIRERLRQFVDYYIPAVTDLTPSPKLVEEFEAILNDIALSLPSCPMGFCHADYHLENLMWNPDKAGGYAVIDFQDAFWGFQGYDLLNLLEDARATVPNDVKTMMKERYCDGMNVQDRENFNNWYVLMSAHFHLRVIGLFIKFSQDNGTTEFMAHIPRLQNYIKEHLKHPMMSPLKNWLENKGVSFDVELKKP